jgi:hypothetical protein
MATTFQSFWVIARRLEQPTGVADEQVDNCAGWGGLAKARQPFCCPGIAAGRVDDKVGFDCQPLVHLRPFAISYPRTANVAALTAA